MTDRVTVTLLAGFLGSGKTTLLDRLLRAPGGERIAVVVNEFGDVGVDRRLVARRDESVVELANGCICCELRGDLRDALVDLAARRRRRFVGRARFDRVVIEASGLASPGPAVQTFLVDGELDATYALGAIVTLAHAAHVRRQLERHPEAGEQIGYADRVLLNHCDEAEDAAIEAAEAALRAANPLATLRRCVRADVPLDELWAPPREERALPEPPPGGHTRGVSSVVLRSERALRRDALEVWLRFVASRRTHELMRAKGVLDVDGAAVAVQGVYQVLELAPLDEAGPPAVSELVLIGRDLDAGELERGWRACCE